jgi:hypothetical protein
MNAPPKLAGLAAGRTGSKRNCIKENDGDGGRWVCPEISPQQLTKAKRQISVCRQSHRRTVILSEFDIAASIDDLIRSNQHNVEA